MAKGRRNNCKRHGGCSNLLTFNRQRVASYHNLTNLCWILDLFSWNDNCFWVDSENWQD